jgi:hypothetical protein
MQMVPQACVALFASKKKNVLVHNIFYVSHTTFPFASQKKFSRTEEILEEDQPIFFFAWFLLYIVTEKIEG